MATPLALKFTNKSGITDPIWIGFWSTQKSTDITLRDGTPLKRINDNKWYKLEELKDGVIINSFESGQIYAAYGAEGWLPNKDGGKPSPVNPDDPAHLLRYDYFELNYKADVNDVADLTIIDSWSIPFSLITHKNGNKMETLNGFKDKVTAQSFYDSMVAHTTPPQSGLPGAQSAGLWNGDKFVRIIGPTAYPPIDGRPVMSYDLFEQYLDFLVQNFGPKTAKDAVIPGLGQGVIAVLAGEYAGMKDSQDPLTMRQNYSLLVKIDDQKNITLAGGSDHFKEINMAFKHKNLCNAPGIYGGNVPFILNNAKDPVAPGNTIYGWLCGDFFTGLITGAIGSQTVVNGIKVGAMPSQQWFILHNQAMATNYFSKLQSNPKHYSQWASTIYDQTNAYGFAYSERYVRVFVSLAPENTDTLEVVLEPAVVTKGAVLQPAPAH